MPHARDSPVPQPVRDAEVRIANALAYREQVETAYASDADDPLSRITELETASGRSSGK